MVAHPPSYFSQTGRCCQSFTKPPESLVSPSVSLLLGANERVSVSHQDGSSWAIAMGTVEKVDSGPKVWLTLDKAVPHDGDVVYYRIDRVCGYSGGVVAGYLAEFCVSDSERSVSERSSVR